MILTFVVRNQTITYVDTKVTPRVGSSNYLQLRFIYTSKDWDTLRKTLHISSKEYSEPFVLESNVFDVPKYYTQQSTFNITLLGDDGQVIVPTNVVTITLDESNNLWTSTPPDAQNSAYITLLNSLGNLEDLDTKTKENIVDAINEVYRTSGVSPEDIAKAVEDYLAEHPAASASMRVEGGYIQFSGDGETWENVIALADLKGSPGSPGSPGKDGLTPHIGDNGNWYLGGEDTGKPSRGAPGAKGDPGKDGAGMDVTGATVGQIAKISAVDAEGKPTAWETIDGYTGQVTTEKLLEPDHPTDLVQYAAFQAAVPLVQTLNIVGATVGQTIKVKTVNDDGVPTAWEPVDMPSGGGEKAWVLVADTVTEEGAVGDQWLRWNKDIAGNAFSYSELIVKVTPKYADNNSHDIIVSLENNKNYWLFDSVLQNDILGIMHFKIILSEGLGLVRGEWTKNSNHHGGSYATVNLWVARNSELFIPVPTSVQIGLRDSPLAGTQIQVYVR